MPLAVALSVVPRPLDAAYGVGRMDASGRVAGRAVTGGSGGPAVTG
jgi:Cys-tRNA synthase (O-phospho-L-seryl-tRNA:Cys-tRNA synthase)